MEGTDCNYKNACMKKHKGWGDTTATPTIPVQSFYLFPLLETSLGFFPLETIAYWSLRTMGLFPCVMPVSWVSSSQMKAEHGLAGLQVGAPVSETNPTSFHPMLSSWALLAGTLSIWSIIPKNGSTQQHKF